MLLGLHFRERYKHFDVGTDSNGEFRTCCKGTVETVNFFIKAYPVIV